MDIIEQIRAEIKRRILKIQVSSIRSSQMDGAEVVLKDLLFLLDTLEEQEKREETERRLRYQESFIGYWSDVLKRIDEKRILPTFKGKTLHDFKNELHTMKQIIGLINHPEIHEGLFDKLALVFAAWGAYYFHPNKTEDTLQEPNAADKKAVKEIVKTTRQMLIKK